MVEARGEHDILLTNTKQKDAKQFEPMQFVKVETLGSITLELVEYIKREKKDKLGKNDKIAWDTFVEAYTAKQATNTADTPCRLHVEEWREFFNKRHTGDTNKAKNDAFRRARERLVYLSLLRLTGFIMIMATRRQMTNCRPAKTAATRQTHVFRHVVLSLSWDEI